MTGVVENKKLEQKYLALLRKHQLPEEWYKTSVRYSLNLTDMMFNLSERLVIDWGKSTFNWVQSKNKCVVQIKPVNSIGDFTSYDRILLSYEDLKK